MHAELTLDLGPESPALEVPWVAETGNDEVDSPGFVDLRAHPQRVRELAEVRAYPPLGEFLLAVNAANSPLATAKCDGWTTHEIAEEELAFGATLKFVTYVDLIFVDHAEQASQARHEEFAQGLCRLLQRAPEIPCSAECVLRRCYFHDLSRDAVTSRDGFCLTLYCTGFGEEEEQAWQRWAIALRLVQNAIAQLFAAR